MVLNMPFTRKNKLIYHFKNILTKKEIFIFKSATPGFQFPASFG
jgi:hypothetical protein